MVWLTFGVDFHRAAQVCLQSVDGSRNEHILLCRARVADLARKVERGGGSALRALASFDAWIVVEMGGPQRVHSRHCWVCEQGMQHALLSTAVGGTGSRVVCVCVCVRARAHPQCGHPHFTHMWPGLSADLMVVGV